MTDGILLVLPERDEADTVAAGLRAAGWAPGDVHPERLAGDDDPEAVEWVIPLATAPDGTLAAVRREELDALAAEHGGFATAWNT